MAVHFKILADGAFVCGDDATGITVYSYPTSIHAKAAQRDASVAARSILAEQPRYRGELSVTAEYDRRNWNRLNSINA